MSVRYQDYYKLLGVERSASDKEIQAAFRKLARKHHPDVDKSVGAEARFKEFTEAYEVLKDADKRRRYDALGENWREGQEFTPRGEHDFPRGFGGAGFESHGGDFSSFFEALFGDAQAARTRGRAGRARARRGVSHEAEVTLTLADLVRGGSHSIALESRERDDEGDARSVRHDYDVRIPVGTTDGTTIRLAGQGARGEGGAPAGDLLLRVRVAPDERFRVDGFDLHTMLRVAPWEAGLGAKVDVALPVGQATLSVPAGSSSGRKLRLRGQGLPKRDGTRGDLTAELQVVLPSELSERERELLAEWARLATFQPRV